MSALEHFIEVWSDQYLLSDLGTKLTCNEAEALADLLRENERVVDGDWLIHEHAEGDEDGDQHRFWDDNQEAWFDHEPRPDDDPGPGDRCRDCGADLTWVGPGIYDWNHALKEED